MRLLNWSSNTLTLKVARALAVRHRVHRRCQDALQALIILHFPDRQNVIARGFRHRNFFFFRIAYDLDRAWIAWSLRESLECNSPQHQLVVPSADAVLYTFEPFARGFELAIRIEFLAQ